MAQPFVLNSVLNISIPANTGSNLKSQIQSQVSSLNIPINLNVKGANSLNSVNAGLSQTNKLATQSSAAFSTFSDQLATTTRRFGLFLIAAKSINTFVNVTDDAINKAIEFQRELVRLKQVGGDTSNVIKGISDEITKLSTSLGVSSNELAEVASTLRQAGFSANETKQALATIAKTNLAPTFGDIKNVTEGVIALRHQFGITGDEIEKTFGAINTVSAQYAVESQDLIEAIQKTGGAFKAAGGNINELLALVTSVRSTTRESADTIATGFRTIFARIQRPEIIENLKNIGVNLQYVREEVENTDKANLAGQFVGPFEAVQRLNKALSEIPTQSPLYASLVEQLGGLRQISKVIPLIKEAGKAQEAYNLANQSGNSLNKDAAIGQEATSVQLTKLNEEFKDLIRTITNNRGFQAFVELLISSSRAAIQLAKALEPLIPLLTTIAVIKGGQGILSTVNALSKNTTAGSAKTPTPRKFAAGGTVPKTSEVSNSIDLLPKYASGGMVGGIGDQDSERLSVPVGSYVIRKKAVSALGSDVQNIISGNENSSGKMTTIMAMPGEAIVYPGKAKQIGYGTLNQLNQADSLDDKTRKTLISSTLGQDNTFAMGGSVSNIVNNYSSVNNLQKYATGGAIQDLSSINTISNLYKNNPTEIGLNPVSSIPFDGKNETRQLDLQNKLVSKLRKKGIPLKSGLPHFASGGKIDLIQDAFDKVGLNKINARKYFRKAIFVPSDTVTQDIDNPNPKGAIANYSAHTNNILLGNKAIYSPGIVRHEVGHAIDFASRNKFSGFKDSENSKIGNSLLEEVPSYSKFIDNNYKEKYRPIEGFAQSFALYGSKLSPNTNKLLDDYTPPKEGSGRSVTENYGNSRDALAKTLKYYRKQYPSKVKIVKPGKELSDFVTNDPFDLGGPEPKFASGGRIRPIQTRLNDLLGKAAKFESKAPTYTGETVNSDKSDISPYIYPKPGTPKDISPNVKLSSIARKELFNPKGTPQPIQEDLGEINPKNVFSTKSSYKERRVNDPIDSSVPTLGITKFRKLFGKKPSIDLDETSSFTDVLRGLLPPGSSEFDPERTYKPVPTSSSIKPYRVRGFGSVLAGPETHDVNGKPIDSNVPSSPFYGRLGLDGVRRVYKFASGGKVSPLISESDDPMGYAKGGRVKDIAKFIGTKDYNEVARLLAGYSNYNEIYDKNGNINPLKGVSDIDAAIGAVRKNLDVEKGNVAPPQPLIVNKRGFPPEVPKTSKLTGSSGVRVSDLKTKYNFKNTKELNNAISELGIQLTGKNNPSIPASQFGAITEYLDNTVKSPIIPDKKSSPSSPYIIGSKPPPLPEQSFGFTPQRISNELSPIGPSPVGIPGLGIPSALTPTQPTGSIIVPDIIKSVPASQVAPLPQPFAKTSLQQNTPVNAFRGPVTYQSQTDTSGINKPPKTSQPIGGYRYKTDTKLDFNPNLDDVDAISPKSVGPTNIFPPSNTVKSKSYYQSVPVDHTVYSPITPKPTRAPIGNRPRKSSPFQTPNSFGNVVQPSPNIQPGFQFKTGPVGGPTFSPLPRDNNFDVDFDTNFNDTEAENIDALKKAYKKAYKQVRPLSGRIQDLFQNNKVDKFAGLAARRANRKGFVLTDDNQNQLFDALGVKSFGGVKNGSGKLDTFLNNFNDNIPDSNSTTNQYRQGFGKTAFNYVKQGLTQRDVFNGKKVDPREYGGAGSRLSGIGKGFGERAANGAFALSVVGGSLAESRDPNAAGLGGALQGAGIGGAAGFQVAGPYGAALGAAAGAVIGFKNSLDELDKSIAQNKLNDSLNQFGAKLSKLDLNDTTLSTQSSAIRTNITKLNPGIDQSPLSFTENLRAGYTDIFGGNGRKSIADERNLVSKNALQSNLSGALPDLTAFGNKIAGSVKSIDEFDKAANGFGRELISLIADARGISSREVAKEYELQIKELQKSTSLQKAFNTALGEISRNSSKFGLLSKAIESASISVEQFDQNLSAALTAFGGGTAPVNTSKNLNLFGSSDVAGYSKGVDFVTSSFANNPIANTLNRTAKGANAAAGVVPSIVGNLLASPNEKQTLPERFRSGLEDASKSNPDISKEVISILTSAFAGIDPNDFFKEAKKNINKFSEDLVSDALPSLPKVLEDAAENIEKNANKYADGLVRNQDLINQVDQGFNKRNSLEVNRRTFQTQSIAESAGRGNTYNGLSINEQLNPFTSKQNNLARTSGTNGLSPTFLGNQLNQTLSAVDTESERRKGLSGESLNSSTKRLVELQGSAQRLRQALENLTDASERNAVIQEKLSKVQTEKSDRKSFLERFISGGVSERFETLRNLEYGKFAARSPIGLDALPVGLQGPAYEALKGLGSVRIPELGGIRANDVADNLVKGFDKLSGGDGQLDKEENVLKALINKNNKDAVAAQDQLNQILGSQQAKFFNTLESAQKSFFDKLAKQLGDANQKDLVLAKSQAQAKLGDVNVAQSKVKEAQLAGILPGNDLSVLRKLSSSSAVATYAADFNKENLLRSSIKDVNKLEVGNGAPDTILKRTTDQLARNTGFERKDFEDLINRYIDEDSKDVGSNGASRAIRNNKSLFNGLGSGLGVPGFNEAVAGVIEGNTTAAKEQRKKELLSNPDTVKSYAKRALEEKLDLTKLGLNDSRVAATKEIGSSNTKQLNTFIADYEKNKKISNDLFSAQDEVAKGFVNLKDATGTLKDSIEELVKANKEASFRVAVPDPRERAMRVAGFAAGGTVGNKSIVSKTDTIPAILSDGEFIVNSKAAHKYRPVLEAMNAGKIPHLADGGPARGTFARAKHNLSNFGYGVKSFPHNFDLPLLGRDYVKTYAQHRLNQYQGENFVTGVNQLKLDKHGYFKDLDDFKSDGASRLQSLNKDFDDKKTARDIDDYQHPERIGYDQKLKESSKFNKNISENQSYYSSLYKDKAKSAKAESQKILTSRKAANPQLFRADGTDRSFGATGNIDAAGPIETPIVIPNKIQTSPPNNKANPEIQPRVVNPVQAVNPQQAIIPVNRNQPDFAAIKKNRIAAEARQQANAVRAQSLIVDRTKSDETKRQAAITKGREHDAIITPARDARLAKVLEDAQPAIKAQTKLDNDRQSAALDAIGKSPTPKQNNVTPIGKIPEALPNIPNNTLPKKITSVGKQSKLAKNSLSQNEQVRLENSGDPTFQAIVPGNRGLTRRQAGFGLTRREAGFGPVNRDQFFGSFGIQTPNAARQQRRQNIQNDNDNPQAGFTPARPNPTPQLQETPPNINVPPKDAPNGFRSVGISPPRESAEPRNDFAQNTQELNKGFTNFAETATLLKKTVDDMGSQIKAFSDVVSKGLNITVERSGKVEVVINGAEVLSKIKDDMEQYIRGEISTQIASNNNSVRNNGIS